MHVIAAPPGAGKSTLTREVIADLLRAGTLERVLWATQSMVGEGTLGHEAAEDFGTRHVTQQIIHSRTNFKRSVAEYEEQFDWSHSGATSVKIVSHVRVRQIFGPVPHLARGLRTADVLVIDEDPFQGLTIHGDSQPSPERISIHKLSAVGSPVGQALLDLAQLIEQEGLGQRHQDLLGRTTGEYLQGGVIWTWFNRSHPDPVDVARFTADLEHLGVREAAVIAQAYADDAARSRIRPNTPPERFGFDWAGEATAGMAALRYDLCVPLTFQQPVVILDGYADRTHYEALFAGCHVVLHEFDPGHALQIECAPRLRVEPGREGTGVQGQHRKQIAEEIAGFTRNSASSSPPRDVLVITPKSLTLERTEWNTFLNDALANEGFIGGDRVLSAHWLAGRGRNAFAGRHVLALNRPRVNRRFAEYTLSALYPYDRAQRLTARDRLIGAESLQMLNRGRQTRFSVTDRPRIVLAEDMDEARVLLGPYADRVNLSEYVPEKMIRKASKNARWGDALIALARELLIYFPNGLPRDLLQALPVHAGRNKSTQGIKLRLEALTSRMAIDSHLYRSFHDPASWVYHDVPASGSDNNRVAEVEVMAAIELTAANGRGRGRGPVVYVREGHDPFIAQTDFHRWLETGVPPAHPPITLSGSSACSGSTPPIEAPTLPEV